MKKELSVQFNQMAMFGDAEGNVIHQYTAGLFLTVEAPEGTVNENGEPLKEQQNYLGNLFFIHVASAPLVPVKDKLLFYPGSGLAITDSMAYDISIFLEKEERLQSSMIPIMNIQITPDEYYTAQYQITSEENEKRQLDENQPDNYDLVCVQFKHSGDPEDEAFCIDVKGNVYAPNNLYIFNYGSKQEFDSWKI